MNTYFEVKTQYSKIGEDGEPKKVSESFLADAISCTDAELIVTKEVQPFSNGEFKIKNIRETTIAELFQRDVEGKWYACRLAMVVEADNGKEDLLQDLVSSITSFCARLYGQRRCKRRTEKIIQ